MDCVINSAVVFASGKQLEGLLPPLEVKTQASLESDLATLEEDPDARANKATQRAAKKITGRVRWGAAKALRRQAQPERTR